MEKKTMRERKAAGGLFNWEVAYSFFPWLTCSSQRACYIELKQKLMARGHPYVLQKSTCNFQNKGFITSVFGNRSYMVASLLLIVAIIFRKKPSCNQFKLAFFFFWTTFKLASYNSELGCYLLRKTFLLFQDEIFVARAPGRLDVMGGIADYSGSLVLQVGCVWFLFWFGIYSWRD